MIDPAFLDELGRFDAVLKRKTTSRYQGEQESPNVGEGLTFSDYRRYAPGDDIRLVDWRVFARTEEFFIKQFEEERNLTLHVLLDASASMDFGEEETHKFEFGAKLALGFAYLFVEENNQFRFSVFTDRNRRLDTGRSSRGELLQLVELLNETPPEGTADFEAALESYAAGVTTRSLVLVVSDFLGDPDALESGLAALARNELVLVQVLTPDELDPAVSGDTIFEDPESDSSLRTYFGSALASQYRNRLDAHVDDVAARAEALGAEHTLVDTGTDFFDAFASVWVG
jgi:uncharacterized protein (DUF58 family)